MPHSCLPHTPTPMPIRGPRPPAPPSKRARTNKSKDPIIIKNINEGWSRQPVINNFNSTLTSPRFHTENSILESGIRNRSAAGMGYSETDSGMSLNPYCGDYLMLGSNGENFDASLLNPGFLSGMSVGTITGFDGRSSLIGSDFNSNSGIGNFGSNVPSSLPPLSIFLPEPGPIVPHQSMTMSTLQGDRGLSLSAPQEDFTSPPHHSLPVPQPASQLAFQSQPKPSPCPTHLQFPANSPPFSAAVSPASASAPAQQVKQAAKPTTITNSPVPDSGTPPLPILDTNARGKLLSASSPTSLLTVTNPPSVLSAAGSDCEYVSGTSISSGPGSRPSLPASPWGRFSASPASLSPMVGAQRVEYIRNGSYSLVNTPTSSRGQESSPSGLPQSVSSDSSTSHLMSDKVNSTFRNGCSPGSFPSALSSPYLNPSPGAVSPEIQQVNEYLDHYLSSSHSAGMEVGKSPSGDGVGKYQHDVIGASTGDVVMGKENRLPCGNVPATPPSERREKEADMVGDSLADDTGSVSQSVQDKQVLTDNTHPGSASGTKAPSLTPPSPSPFWSQASSSASDSTETERGHEATPTPKPLPVNKLLSKSCEATLDLLTVFQDHHEVPLFVEEISDSGVSSLGTKPSITSCSSESSSPYETTTPPMITSPYNPLRYPSGHFSYPSTPQVSSPSYHRLLDPIPEPFSSLSSNAAEYMLLDPELKPPQPPEPEEGMDLHPKVEIYQVRGVWTVCLSPGSISHISMSFPPSYLHVLTLLPPSSMSLPL